MAEQKSSAKVMDTWKQKKWYKIVSPQLFGAQQIGETVALDDAAMMGRNITVSLMIVTGDPKKQSISGTFEVDEVKSGAAYTKLKKLEIAPSSIRRMMRKGKERIDLSFVCMTADNIAVRIKPFMITRAKTGGIVLTKINKLAEDLIRFEVHRTNFEVLIQDILMNKLQRKLKARLNKIYPLKSVEIRSIEKTVVTKALPPVPQIEEWKEAKVEETEEEKVVKKAKEVKVEPEKAVEVKEKKPKAKKTEKVEVAA